MEWTFRGWDAVGKKRWVYGDLVHNQKVTLTGLEPRVMVGGYEVVPESVGISTGLKDVRGKDIYEGDIVVFIDDRNGEKLFKSDVHYRNGRFCIANAHFGHFEIIGNMFEEESKAI